MDLGVRELHEAKQDQRREGREDEQGARGEHAVEPLAGAGAAIAAPATLRTATITNFDRISAVSASASRVAHFSSLGQIRATSTIGKKRTHT